MSTKKTCTTWWRPCVYGWRSRDCTAQSSMHKGRQRCICNNKGTQAVVLRPDESTNSKPQGSKKTLAWDGGEVHLLRATKIRKVVTVIAQQQAWHEAMVAKPRQWWARGELDLLLKDVDDSQIDKIRHLNSGAAPAMQKVCRRLCLRFKPLDGCVALSPRKLYI
jgi:hypothetical protein